MKIKDQKITKRYSIYNGDCIPVMKNMPADSVGMCIHSPPFASLYSYSDADEDLGNSKTYAEFFTHYGFVVEQLARIMKPGRIVAVHCMDLPTFKSQGSEIGVADFPGDIVDLYKLHGFIPHSHHCIWKDPLIAATRSHSISLAHKQIVKDSAMCATGLADYIWAFRKPGDNPEPIAHPLGLTRYVGERQVPRELNRYLKWPDPKTNKRSHWIWQQYASPVWFDIRQTRVLPYKKGRDNDDARHICPLQLDVIERCLVLWSNKGDIVLTPFMGVGSEVYVAVQMKRKGLGIELKGSYYRQAVRNLESLKHQQNVTKIGV